MFLALKLFPLSFLLVYLAKNIFLANACLSSRYFFVTFRNSNLGQKFSYRRCSIPQFSFSFFFSCLLTWKETHEHFHWDFSQDIFSFGTWPRLSNLATKIIVYYYIAYFKCKENFVLIWTVQKYLCLEVVKNCYFFLLLFFFLLELILYLIILTLYSLYSLYFSLLLLI